MVVVDEYPPHSGLAPDKYPAQRQYINLLKSFYVLVLILYSTSANSFECKPWHLFGYYLVNTKYIFEAEVVKSSDKVFKIKMIDVYRSPEKMRGEIRIKYNHLIKAEYNCIPQNLCVPQNRYVFFVKKNLIFPYQFYISEPCNRFKVVNDSLFIGSSFLSGLNGVDSSQIFSKNIFNDSLMPNGYKISTKDFKTLIENVNECFVPSYVPSGASINNYVNPWYRRAKSKRKIYGYIYYPPRTTDPFTLAIIAQLKEAWGL
ncbi:MAG: hypothetical protein JNJ99_01575 [Crocinitomicaceae bacterium]|nr:hypothetical protein [Crocinitomicaceae bacterium]